MNAEITRVNGRWQIEITEIEPEALRTETPGMWVGNLIREMEAGATFRLVCSGSRTIIGERKTIYYLTTELQSL